MAYKVLTALGAGEITPELSERDNLDKVRTGLKALRNGLVTKYGGVRSRLGTVFGSPLMANTETYYTPFHTVVNKEKMFQFKKSAIVVYYNFSKYGFGNSTSISIPTPYTVADLAKLHFSNDDKYLYVFCEGKSVLRMLLESPYTINIITDYNPNIVIPPAKLFNAYLTADWDGFTAPTGERIEYGVTFVKDGVESYIKSVITKYDAGFGGGVLKMPISTNQANRVRYGIIEATGQNYTVDELPDEVRFYRRPYNSGAWGFIGLAVPIQPGPPDANDWLYMIADTGQDANFEDQPPDLVTGFKQEGDIKPKTGLIYQNRLLINGTKNPNKAFASRTDNPLVFTRDFPLQDDSAVAFKTGSDGSANIGRFFDGRGAMMTTNIGVYETPSDILKFDTAFAIKRSDVIHDDILQVLPFGNGILLTDKRINGIFKLTPSGENFDYNSTEISIFSDHLFQRRRMVSWIIQDSGVKVLWIVRDDGVLLSLTLQEDQQLLGWARHDFQGGKVKQVINLKRANYPDTLLLVVNTNASGAPGGEIVLTMSERNLDELNYIGTDYTTIYKNQMVGLNKWIDATNNESVPFFQDGVLLYNGQTDLTVADNIARDVIPLGDRFEGMLVLSTGAGTRYQLVGGITNANWQVFSGPFQNVAGLGAVGTVFRFYNDTTGEYVEYNVTAYTNSLSVEVELNSDFERDFYAVMGTTELSFKLYNMFQTFQTLTGLAYLEGKKVSVRGDGTTLASPLNKVRNYDEYTVSSGQIALSSRVAYASVGLPIVTDIQTFDSESTEQVSDKMTSTIVNKLFISYYKSRGLYVGSDFPPNDTNEGMEDHEEFFEPDEGIASYLPQSFYSRREEVVINGDWAAASSTAFRNVDPQPVSVRGFILDVEELGG